MADLLCTNLALDSRDVHAGSTFNGPKNASGNASESPPKGTFLLHDADGGLHAADAPGGLVRYKYASLGAPPYARQEFVTTDTDSADPRMAIFSTTQRIALLWYDGTDIVVAYSDDHGESWTTPMTLFSGGTHCMPIATDVGSVIHTAWVSGEIRAIEELMDGSWTADSPWTLVDSGGSPITFPDLPYGITLANRENVARYFLDSGGVGYWSGDDLRTLEAT